MSHQNITYSNSYLIRSMEMSLTVFTMDSEKSVRCFSILFLHFLWKNRVKTCVTLKYYILQLLLDEEHGDVLDHVHHWLLEVRERVFDIIFAFLMKNYDYNIVPHFIFQSFCDFFSCMNQTKIMYMLNQVARYIIILSVFLL